MKKKTERQNSEDLVWKTSVCLPLFLSLSLSSYFPFSLLPSPSLFLSRYPHPLVIFVIKILPFFFGIGFCLLEREQDETVPFNLTGSFSNCLVITDKTVQNNKLI